MKLGERIRRARENAGLTQSELATAVGRGRSTVYNWEHHVADPAAPMLAKIRRALGVDDNFDPLPSGASEASLDALSNTELISHMHMLVAEAARRLGNDGSIGLVPGTEERMRRTPGAVQITTPDDQDNRRAGSNDNERRHAR